MLWSDHVLANKRVLITGASSGIGRECAILFSKLGAELIIMGRDSKRLQDTLENLTGKEHIKIKCDLCNENQLKSSLLQLDMSIPLSGFVHCAGIERTNPIKTIEMDDFVDMFRLNVASAVSIASFLSSPKVYDKSGSSIVLMSSVSGINGEKGKIEYSTTKSAMFGMVKAMASELSGKGIRVNSISPAMIETAMLKQLFTQLPEESVNLIKMRHRLGIPGPLAVADSAAFLVSDLSKHITGIDIKLDSGYSL